MRCARIRCHSAAPVALQVLVQIRSFTNFAFWLYQLPMAVFRAPIHAHVQVHRSMLCPHARAHPPRALGGLASAVRALPMPSVCRLARNKRRSFAAAPLLARGVCAVHLAVRAAVHRVVRRWRAGGRVQHLPRCALATSAPRLGSPLRSPRGILRGCSHALPYFVCKCARVREPVCALTLACVQGTDGPAHCGW
jgi:hypothetical protein